MDCETCIEELIVFDIVNIKSVGNKTNVWHKIFNIYQLKLNLIMIAMKKEF